MRKVSGDPCSIEGARAVLEALRAGRRRVLEVWAPADPRGAAAREILERARAAGARLHPVERAGELRAVAEPYPEETVEELLGTLAPPRFLVALDGVTDVGNLGSIARSAETAGAAGLVLELRGSAPVGPAALRASSGALEHLRVGRAPNLAKALRLASSEGLCVLAADAGGIALDSIPRERLSGELVWVFGSEEEGIREGIRKNADFVVGIPQHGRIESLGVAAAAAVLLHGTAALRFGTGASE